MCTVVCRALNNLLKFVWVFLRFHFILTALAALQTQIQSCQYYNRFTQRRNACLNPHCEFPIELSGSCKVNFLHSFNMFGLTTELLLNGGMSFLANERIQCEC